MKRRVRPPRFARACACNRRIPPVVNVVPRWSRSLVDRMHEDDVALAQGGKAWGLGAMVGGRTGPSGFRRGRGRERSERA